MRYEVKEDRILIEELSIIFPKMSTSKIRKMLTNNRVELDGVVVNKAKKEVFTGSIIVIKNKIKTSKIIKDCKLEIIYEDEKLIVVNKPNKLLSVATNKLEKDTMHSRVLDYLKSKNSNSWGWIVHRLDKDTSGVMVFAKEEEVKLMLQKQFSENIVTRKYLAIVDGTPYRKVGRIENYIAEGKSLIVRECNKKVRGARIAITNWKIIKSKKSHSLVEILIETGRRNQIRVHMAGIKCPVSGDKKYGSVTDPLNRLCLHAENIEFIHPSSLQKMKFSAKNVFNNFFN